MYQWCYGSAGLSYPVVYHSNTICNESTFVCDRFEVGSGTTAMIRRRWCVTFTLHIIYRLNARMIHFCDAKQKMRWFGASSVSIIVMDEVIRKKISELRKLYWTLTFCFIYNFHWTKTIYWFINRVSLTRISCRRQLNNGNDNDEPFNVILHQINKIYNLYVWIKRRQLSCVVTSKVNIASSIYVYIHLVCTTDHSFRLLSITSIDSGHICKLMLRKCDEIREISTSNKRRCQSVSKHW